MIQARNGIFETNSSSVHAISVYTVPPKEIPHAVCLHTGEYGWANGIHPLADYVFTACAEMNRVEELTDMLHRVGVEHVVTIPAASDIAKCHQANGYLKYDMGYIDHCCLGDFIDAILCDEELFKCAMFNQLSQVETGNDNIYEDEQIPTPIEGEHWYTYRKWN